MDKDVLNALNVVQKTRDDMSEVRNALRPLVKRAVRIVASEFLA